MLKHLKVTNRKTKDVVEFKDTADFQARIQNAAKANPAIAGQLGELNKKDSSAPVKAFMEREGIELDQVWKMLGIENVGMQKVQNLYQNDYLKPFFNTQVEQGFRTGYETGGRASELIATTVNMDQMSYQYYYDDTFGKNRDASTESELGYNEIAQGAPIPVVSIKVANDKTIFVAKRGKGLEITDEAKSMNMDMLAIHARKQGNILSRQDQARAVQRLRNGYFADGSDAADSEAAKDSAALIPSLWYAVQKMEDETGMTPNRIVMNRERFYQYMTQLDGQGNFLFLQQMMQGSDEDNTSVLGARPFIDNSLANNEIMLVDTRYALANYSFKALSTETDRYPDRQVEGSYTTVIDDYIPWDPTARRIITFS